MTLQSKDMGKLVAVDTDIQGGEPCIAGTRVTVRAVQKFAAAGCSIVQISDQYPTLTFEQIDAALAFRPAHREAQPETDRGIFSDPEYEFHGGQPEASEGRVDPVLVQQAADRLQGRADKWSLNGDSARISVRLGDIRTILAALASKGV